MEKKKTKKVSPAFLALVRTIIKENRESLEILAKN